MMKRRGSMTEAGKPAGLTSVSSLATIAQIGLSKSFRRMNNPDRRSQSVRKVFRALVFAVIAINRLRPRLSQTEIEQIKLLYDNSGGVDSVTMLVLLMQHSGIHGTDDVCRSALSDIGYKDGHLMTKEQFRHAFEHCKRDLIGKAKRNDDTLDAFTALGGGEDAIDPETMATAIEEFGLTVDVQLFAQGGVSTTSALVQQAAAAAASVAGKGGGRSPPSAVPIHVKSVTYDRFSQFFNSSVESSKNTNHRAHTKAAHELQTESSDGWWTRSGHEEDDYWLETNSPAWSPPKIHQGQAGFGSSDKTATPLSALERFESTIEFSEAAASPNFHSTKSFESGATSITAVNSDRRPVKGQSTVVETTPTAPPTSLGPSLNVLNPVCTSARVEASRADHSGVVAEVTAESGVQPAAVSTAQGGTPSAHAETALPARLGMRAEGDDAPTNIIDRTDMKRPSSRSPVRSEGHRPVSALSHRSTRSSWADFLERSQQDVERRRHRLTSAPSCRRKRDFVVPCTEPGSCINPPPASCFWREAKIEKHVLRALETSADQHGCASACDPIQRPPFVLRPTSAAVVGSASKVARQLRPSSAAPSTTIRLLSAVDASRSSTSTANQLMSRWVSGGNLACGAAKPRRRPVAANS